MVPNAAIYNEAFAELWHALDSEHNFNQIELDDDMEKLARDFYRDLSADTVRSEDDYLAVVEHYLPQFFPGFNFQTKRRVYRHRLDTELDFVVTCTTPYGVEAILLCGETKLKEGGAGSGPVQALFAYRRAYVNPAVSEESFLCG